jgi:ubiquinone/menaquinone biosynthesis C-methylase UbiE
LHPGGLELTERLAQLAGITAHSRVLDIAGGWGTTSIFLANRFHCTVIDLDLSPHMRYSAKAYAKTTLSSGQVNLTIGDAESLPFTNACFDIIISECSLCLFPSKKTALTEMYRVIKPTGIVAISDVTITDVPSDLNTPLLTRSCIAGAESLRDMKRLFINTGFQVESIDVSEVIDNIIQKIRHQSAYLKPILRILCKNNDDLDYHEFSTMGRTLEQLFVNGNLGYGLILARH